jgi:hypothetical protein
MVRRSIDPSLARPSPYKFHISGHKHAYVLTELVPYYGTRFCDRLADAWRVSYEFRPGASYGNFKHVRTLFLGLALKGLASSRTMECRLYESFRDIENFIPDEREWGDFIFAVCSSMENFSDTTWMNSSNPKSRTTFVEALRVGLKDLSRHHIVPEVPVGARIDNRGKKPPKCLATLSYEAGRINLAGMSPKDAANEFGKINSLMLEELRRIQCEIIIENLNKFQIGKSIINATNLPSPEEIMEVISSTWIDRIEAGELRNRFADAPEPQFQIAVRMYKFARSNEMAVPERAKLNAFIRSLADTRSLQPYVEGTIEAMDAAFHTVMVDTGINPQPNEDIPLDLYVGAAKHGKRQIRSVATPKNRAGGKTISVDLAEGDWFLTTKSTPDRPSGVKVVDMWLEISAPMRSETGPTAEKLWIFRRHDQLRVRTDLAHVGLGYLKRVLEENAENPIIGGLPITRRTIRTAVSNSKRHNADFDYTAIQALLGHSTPSMPFAYMSEGAMRAFLNAQIRDFVDQFEATLCDTIEEAAKTLGVQDSDMRKLAQLGIENGLSFARIDGGSPLNGVVLEDAEAAAILKPEAKRFTISEKSMMQLDVARRALWEQFEKVVNLNPFRFVTAWMDWLVIVGGYCFLLEKGRFRVQFRKVRAEIDARLQAGSIRLPLLW